MAASHGRLIDDAARADQISSDIAIVLCPASLDEISGSVVTLLSFYPRATGSKTLATETADIWLKHLEQFPAWAIKEACEWYVGPGNPPDRRSWRPLPGDIADQCQTLLNSTWQAARMVSLWNEHKGDYPAWMQRSYAKFGR